MVLKTKSNSDTQILEGQMEIFDFPEYLPSQMNEDSNKSNE